jgi:sec-independent protein translocase protein TatA
MPFGDLFDSPWKILIIAAVILILFGSRKMPAAARSLGRSMRILKSEVRGLHSDDEDEGTADAPAASYVPAQQGAAPQAAQYGTAQQPQPAIPQQVTSSTGNPGGAAAPTTEAQRTSQPG